MFIKPMRAKKDNHEGVPKGDYLYEMKYDGIRACLVYDRRDGLTIYSKSGADITRKFPELIDPVVLDFVMNCNRATFDCELVCYKNGIPDFGAITSRFHLGSQAGWDQGAIDNPATACVFDILSLEGEGCMMRPLTTRKRFLRDHLKSTGPYERSRTYDNGEALYRAQKKLKAEGIIAKKRLSTYQPGRRLVDWLKVKIMYKETVEVYGFIEGKGTREGKFGSLLFRGLDGRPAGKVGTGFTFPEVDEMWEFLDTRDPVYQIDGRATETFLLDKPFRAVVKGMRKNKSGAIREPVFIKKV
jgi:bifunctional non-homologous end joining protein LigD